MNNRKHRTASDIYRTIVNSQDLRGYTVIITGRTGPTGKSTLYKLLYNAGIRVFDISEGLNSHINYTYNNENKLIVDPYNETVLVVLNRIR